MALGKGLGALIASTGGKQPPKSHITAVKEPNAEEKLWLIPLSEIRPEKNQPRKKFDEAALAELAESIKEHGILQPLILAEKKDGAYGIIAGERRYRAAKLAGLVEVPALVKVLPEREKLEISLIENIQREDLNPIEEAFAFQRLAREFNLTQEELARRVGKSRPAVANAMRLLDLPNPAQQALIEKKINSGQARALLSLRNEKDQLNMLASMLGRKITVRELERAASRHPGNKSRRDPNLTYFEEQLRAVLGTKVSITRKGDKGKIIIDYYSTEEFKEILGKIQKK